MDDVRTPGKLPDGTAAANAGGSNGSLNIAAQCVEDDENYGRDVYPYGLGGTERQAAPELGHDHPVTMVKVDAEVLKKGFAVMDVDTTPVFSIDDSGGENSVGDPLTKGGFLGRPRGTAR